MVESRNNNKVVYQASDSASRSSILEIENESVHSLQNMQQNIPKNKTVSNSPAAKNMRESVMFLKMKKQKLAQSLMDTGTSKGTTNNDNSSGKQGGKRASLIFEEKQGKGGADMEEL